MSVLVSKRKESKLEVVIFSTELHSMLIELMQRNFGVKNLKHAVRRRYHCTNSNKEGYDAYRYLMQNFKNRIDNLASSLTSNVRAANSLYPTTVHEYERRRDFQNDAIVNCEQIIKELQQVVEVFDVDINLYNRYVHAIDRELGLIKKWRQSDNKIKSRL